MTEIWKPVVGFEGAYEVSDLGRVRSLDRIVTVTQRFRGGKIGTYQRRMPGVLLRPGIASNGYPSVALNQQTFMVHELVTAAFLGPKPPGHCVRHVHDNDRANVRLDNLSYGTYVENSADMDAHGTRMRGSKYSSAKLTEAQAREIRSLHYKVTQSALAERYGVSPACIQAIHDGRTWTHA
jgi:hypothetical protein